MRGELETGPGQVQQGPARGTSPTSPTPSLPVRPKATSQGMQDVGPGRAEVAVAVPKKLLFAVAAALRERGKWQNQGQTTPL